MGSFVKILWVFKLFLKFSVLVKTRWRILDDRREMMSLAPFVWATREETASQSPIDSGAPRYTSGPAEELVCTGMHRFEGKGYRGNTANKEGGAPISIEGSNVSLRRSRPE